jgi:hypothetical protein
MLNAYLLLSYREHESEGGENEEESTLGVYRTKIKLIAEAFVWKSV